MKNLIIIKHIPHASLEIPKCLQDTAPFNTSLFQKYNCKMSDVGVDKLFTEIDGIEIKAKYSRLFCDVERFKDSKLEPMAKLGMGYKYSRYYDSKFMFRPNIVGYINVDEYTDNYYDKYHAKFNKVVKEQIDKGHEVLILDIHSYSNDLADALGKKGPC